MVSGNDFGLFSVQVTAFTPSVEQFRPAHVLAPIIRDFSDRYDGDIESTTPPANLGIIGSNVSFASGVTLTSGDGRWKFHATPERADSHWQSQFSAEDAQADIEQICHSCLQPLFSYPASGETQIGRLAFVTRRWVAADDPANDIASRFCNPELVNPASETAPFRHTRNLDLHNMKRYASGFDGVEVNSWVRCRSSININDQRAIAIEQDLNTLKEESVERAFHQDKIQEFIDWALVENRHILDLYFPVKQ